MAKTPRREPAPREARVDLDGLLRPFFSDSALWPVLFVLVAALSTIGAAGLVTAVRHRNPFAAAALLGLAFLSVEALRGDLRRRRRSGRRGLGSIGTLIGLLWLLSSGVALLASRYDLL